MEKYDRVIVCLSHDERDDLIVSKISNYDFNQLIIVSSINFNYGEYYLNTSEGFNTYNPLIGEYYINDFETNEKMIKELIKTRLEYINSIKEKLPFDDINVVVELSSPANLIIDQVDLSLKNLIIIGSRKKNGIHSHLIGSTSKYIASHAPCDVLICK